MYSFKENLIRYVDAGFPIIYVDSSEEANVTEEIQSLFKDKGILEWNIRGLFDYSNNSSLQDQGLEESLELILVDKEISKKKIFFIKGLKFFIEDVGVIERLKILAQKINEGEIKDATIFIVAPNLKFPLELEQYVTVLNIDFLTEEEIKAVIIEFVEEYQLTNPNENFLNELSVLFKGLNKLDIKNILSLATSSDGELNRSDFSLIFEHKQQLIRKSGILDMIPVVESINDIGGLDNLKNWLQRKSSVFQNITKARAFGVDVPKGVLIVGMPGCGKSLTAKATAKLFNIPLLRLDMGRLMGKYVGESEGNLRRAISLADACSPCVLWIDELEKAFAGIGEQGGSNEVTSRLFGHFLTWLQEKNSLTFVIATANNIAILPPELLRKGRFDEIFYVNLPDKNEREKIFNIHIAKRRKQDLPSIDINKLVEKTEGFSGADIEGVIKDTVELAFTSNRSKITTNDILASISLSNSLADTLKDSIEKLSKFYKDHKFKSASV